MFVVPRTSFQVPYWQIFGLINTILEKWEISLSDSMSSDECGHLKIKEREKTNADGTEKCGQFFAYYI